MKKFILLIAVVALLSLNGISQAITIETVAVGNVGNAADTASHSGNFAGQGYVGYNYNIGKYEVTTGQYTAFLNAVAATDTYDLYSSFMADTVNMWGCNIQRTGNSGSYSYTVGNGSQTDITNWANRPVNYVSWGDAVRFANWLHNAQPTGAQGLATTEDGAYYLNGATTDPQLQAINREADWKWAITSEDEWYKAAYYDPNKGGTGIGGYWSYPTRSNTAPANQVLSTDPGNSSNYIGNGLYTIGSPYRRTNVGEFENSDSAYGTFDQGGNVWERNEAVIRSGGYRGLRGGSFYDSISGIRSDNPYNSVTSSYENNNIGFRVVQIVPEPSTIIVLLGGIAGLLGVRRRKV